MGSANPGRPSGDSLTVEGERREHDGVLVVRPAGEITIATAAAFEERLQEARKSGATRVLVDLRRVDFVDSIGLRALIKVAESCWSAGIEFAFGPELSPAVERTLRVTQLIEALPFAGETGRAPGAAEADRAPGASGRPSAPGGVAGS